MQDLRNCETFKLYTGLPIQLYSCMIGVLHRIEIKVCDSGYEFNLQVCELIL